MKRLAFLVALAAGLAVPGMSAAGAIGANPPPSCGVGQPVSFATQVVGGLGTIVTPPAGFIQTVHADIKGSC